MAPEMAQRGGVSTLVDVYALGVTLYQMLTGRYPYEADTPMGVLMAHMSQPIPDVREERPTLPDSVQMVIERAMAKDPMDRYQTPGELAEALTVKTRSLRGGESRL
jgi:serine/threonine-protein kinase